MQAGGNEAKRAYAEQRERYVDGERERERQRQYSVYLQFHPPKVQMRTRSYIRCLEISLLEGSRQRGRSDIRQYKMHPISNMKQIEMCLCDDTKAKTSQSCQTAPSCHIFKVYNEYVGTIGTFRTHQELGKDHIQSYTSEQNKGLRKERTFIGDTDDSPW